MIWCQRKAADERLGQGVLEGLGCEVRAGEAEGHFFQKPTRESLLSCSPIAQQGLGRPGLDQGL